MKRKTRTVTVKVSSDQQVIVTNKPKSHQIPRLYFFKWKLDCRNVPVGYWARAGKKRKDGSRPEPQLVKIDEMHPAQLWMTIRWCWKLAAQTVAADIGYIDKSPAQLLATVPKWAELLEAGRKRRLQMFMFRTDWEPYDEFLDYVAAELGDDTGWMMASWYKRAIVAIDMAKKEQAEETVTESSQVSLASGNESPF